MPIASMTASRTPATKVRRKYTFSLVAAHLASSRRPLMSTPPVVLAEHTHVEYHLVITRVHDRDLPQVAHHEECAKHAPQTHPQGAPRAPASDHRRRTRRHVSRRSDGGDAGGRTRSSGRTVARRLINRIDYTIPPGAEVPATVDRAPGVREAHYSSPPARRSPRTRPGLVRVCCRGDDFPECSRVGEHGGLAER